MAKVLNCVAILFLQITAATEGGQAEPVGSGAVGMPPSQKANILAQIDGTSRLGKGEMFPMIIKLEGLY